MTKKKKRFPVFKIVLFSLVVLITTVYTVFFLYPAFSGNNKTYGIYEKAFSSSDWMKYLDDSLLISAVNVPGTHDSATQYVQLPYFSRCQSTGIKTQLENGFRYLDIRLGVEKRTDTSDRLKLMHGFTNCKTSWLPYASFLYLEDVLEQCILFLSEHKSETIIFCVKQENGDETNKEFTRLLFSYIDKTHEHWYLENKIPSLKEVRGKIILARRFQNNPELEPCGVNLTWNNQSNRHVAPDAFALEVQENGTRLFVQDRFKYDSEDKWTVFNSTLEAAAKDARSDSVYLNFLSTNGNTVYGHPIKYAIPLNEKLQQKDFLPRRRLGWVILDFGVKELAQKIYMTNFEKLP